MAHISVWEQPIGTTVDHVVCLLPEHHYMVHDSNFSNMECLVTFGEEVKSNEKELKDNCLRNEWEMRCRRHGGQTTFFLDKHRTLGQSDRKVGKVLALLCRSHHHRWFLNTKPKQALSTPGCYPKANNNNNITSEFCTILQKYPELLCLIVST